MRILLVTNRIKTYPLMYRLILDSIHELGHEVVWAADFTGFIGDIKQIPCETKNITIHSNPFNLKNVNAYFQILNIIDEFGIDGVMCNTPIGGTLGRLAAKQRKVKPVVYTAHGFLFFRGAPMINRILFKLHEEWLARYTDTLITITEEDYEASKLFHIRGNNKPFLIHGAGIELGNMVDLDGNAKRDSLGLPRDAFIIMSAGELNKNKNTKVMVRAMTNFKDSNVHYIVCGIGNEEQKLKALARDCGVENKVHFLGYRTDIPELLLISDAFVMMSFREGLPRSIMEAMNAGLPCIGSDTRGIRDLIDVGKGGFICNPRKPREFVSAIIKLKETPELCAQFGAYNKEKVKPYSCYVVKEELLEIYRESFI